MSITTCFPLPCCVWPLYFIFFAAFKFLIICMHLFVPVSTFNCKTIFFGPRHSHLTLTLFSLLNNDQMCYLYRKRKEEKNRYITILYCLNIVLEFTLHNKKKILLNYIIVYSYIYNVLWQQQLFAPKLFFYLSLKYFFWFKCMLKVEKKLWNI